MPLRCTRAVQAYGGAVVLVTHDRRLISDMSSELWEVKGGSVQRLEGSFDDYMRRLQISRPQVTSKEK